MQHPQASAEPYEVFYFDDNQSSADELAVLVMAGAKRATASLLWSYEAEGEPLPKVGDLRSLTHLPRVGTSCGREGFSQKESEGRLA